MDKVKQFWNTVVKEREDFWGSLFRKYEEDRNDVDVTSYMENTPKRISALLNLTKGEGTTESNEYNPKVFQYVEEQPGDLVEAVPENKSQTSDISDPVNPKALELTGSTNSPTKLVSEKKRPLVPLFVSEITGEEDGFNTSQQLPFAKKFKLFEPILEPNEEKSSMADNSESCISMNESRDSDKMNESHISLQENSVSFLCRRKKSRGKLSTPKRFKLA